jgi:hypothetical protein
MLSGRAHEDQGAHGRLLNPRYNADTSRSGSDKQTLLTPPNQETRRAVQQSISLLRVRFRAEEGTPSVT